MMQGDDPHNWIVLDIFRFSKPSPGVYKLENGLENLPRN